MQFVWIGKRFINLENVRWIEDDFDKVAVAAQGEDIATTRVPALFINFTAEEGLRLLQDERESFLKWLGQQSIDIAKVTPGPNMQGAYLKYRELAGVLNYASWLHLTEALHFVHDELETLDADDRRAFKLRDFAVELEQLLLLH